MAKGIIVVDMPADCLHCKFRYVICADGERFQHCSLDTYGYKRETFFKKEDLEEGFKSDWCPIKPMPDKMKSQSRQGWFEKAVAAGWNRCINTILGVGDE